MVVLTDFVSFITHFFSSCGVSKVLRVRISPEEECGKDVK